MTGSSAGPDLAEDPADRRSWIPIVVVLTVIVVGLVFTVVTRPHAVVCSHSIAAKSPLLSRAGMAQQPDERLDTLTTAVDGWGSPFGKVTAGVGFDYGQFLHLYGLADGILAFTKNNAPVTLLADETLKPRWALKPTSKRIAWDASSTRFALLDLDSKAHSRLGSYDLRTGQQKWCVGLNSKHRDGQPVSTAFLDGGDLLVALPSSDGLQLARVKGSDGRVTWSVPAKDAGRADYVGALDSKTVIAGGIEEYGLAETPTSTPGGPVLEAYAVKDGKKKWTWTIPRGAVAHVIGVEDQRVLVVTRNGAKSDVVALDKSGKEAWRRPQQELPFQSTLRSGVVLLRSGAGLTALDASTGDQLWHRAVPVADTYFPYGFTLDQMPSLDADHVLMPTTTALRVLEVRTGKDLAYPLPKDGVSTTYWPYQLAVTDKLFAVVTNTGGVVGVRG